MSLRASACIDACRRRQVDLADQMDVDAEPLERAAADHDDRRSEASDHDNAAADQDDGTAGSCKGHGGGGGTCRGRVAKCCCEDWEVCVVART